MGFAGWDASAGTAGAAPPCTLGGWAELMARAFVEAARVYDPREPSFCSVQTCFWQRSNRAQYSCTGLTGSHVLEIRGTALSDLCPFDLIEPVHNSAKQPG